MEKSYIEDIPQDCVICNYKCKNRRSLGNHVARSHKDVGDLMNYCLKFFLDDVNPLCLCGCGKETAWHKTQFKFNTYLTGHNCSGFKKEQPHFTKEQLDKRSAKIRETYNVRGKEIKEKISKSVTLALENSPALCAANKKKWDSDDFREKQRISRIKSWQGEAGQARRDKVFTPEFGRKIGFANSKRDMKKTSNAEEKFASHLQMICSQYKIETSKWFNFSQKTWCADIWIPETKTIIEFDGSFWHGLDRKSNFCFSQITNMSNDIRKNKIAIQNYLNLIRIDESSDWKKTKTFEDIVKIAYHIVKNGVVEKEGTLKLSDTQIFVSKEDIILQNIKEGGKEITKSELLPAIQEFFSAYVDYWGWFYPITDETLSYSLTSLKHAAGSLEFTKSTHGSKWLKSNVRSFWDVDNGPVKSFQNKKNITSVCSYRLGLNNSKMYDYTLESGETVKTNETFDITLSTIRNGFVVQRNKVSWFKPQWAAVIYKKYLVGIQCPKVWDPSVGFSSRLLGFSSVVDSGTYVGTDPSTEVCRDARLVSREITEIKTGLTFEIIQSGSEVVKLQSESFDLVFTSPPYFDTEQYFHESGQCWFDYPQIDLWKEKYLVPTLRNAFECLKPSAKMIINISEKFVDDIDNCAKSIGFKLTDTIELKMGKDHFFRNVDAKSKLELFLVFEK